MTIKELIGNFEANYGRMLSPFEIEDIQKLVDEDGYPADLVNEALRIAIGNGKYFVNYVIGILIRMKSRGIRTVAELKASEEEKRMSQAGPTKHTLETIDKEIRFLENVIVPGAETWAEGELRARTILDAQNQIKELLQERQQYL